MRAITLHTGVLAICALATYAWAAPLDTNRGLLAEAVYATAIHESPSGYSRVMCKVPKDMRLVVRPTSSKYWTEVLLTSGAFGYLPTDSLKIYPLEYEIKRPTAPRYGAPVASRGEARGGYRHNGALNYDPARNAIAENAFNFLGVPYKWGGNDVTGIDCSGLVKKLYGEVGVGLPRTAAEQAMVGTPITRLEDLRAGDRLYFWEAKRGKIGHTGVYIGGGYFIHASSGHHEVAKEYLGQPKWLRILVGARR